MRKLLLLLLPILLAPLTVFGQRARPGDSDGPLPGVRTVETVRAPDGTSDADLVTFDGGLAPRLLTLAPEESMRVASWPVAPGVQKDVVLTRRDIYAPDAKIVVVEGSQEIELPRSRLTFFLGEIQDDTKGRVMVSVDPDTGTFGGFSATDEGTFEIVPPRGRRTRYLVASPSGLRGPGEPEPTWRCEQEELPPVSGDYIPRAEARQPLVQNPPTKVAVLAIDTDNEFMSQKFSDNTTNATNYIASLVASITTIYERDTLVRIYEGYTILRVSTTADPYTTTGTPNPPYCVSGSGNADCPRLMEFSNYWSANYGNIRRTITTILSGKQPGSSSASGIAWVPGLCSSTYGYSFCQIFKIDYLYGDTLIVAHEMGHNFGSPHTQCYSPPPDCCYNQDCNCGTTSCPNVWTVSTLSGATVPNVTGTLMSYCQLFGSCESGKNQLVFHPRSYTDTGYLRDKIAAATACIFAIGYSAPMITSLDVPSGPTAGGTSTNITGTNFRSGATVAFANLTNSVGAASVTFNSSTSLTVQTPAHGAGAVDVVVMNPDFQTATLPGGFTYTTSTPPTVTAISPNAGSTAGGTPVTITGSGFVSGATVALGGVAATSVVVVNSTTITATTGAHATGTVSVVVTNPDFTAGTFPSGFFYGPSPSSTRLYTITPCRVLDTRNPNSPLGGPALNGSGAQRVFTVTGTCGIPASAKSVSVNLTVTQEAAAGSLTVYPGNGIPTGTSSINFAAGKTRANNAILYLATDGTGSIGVENDSSGTVHFILDVNGYFQ